MKTPLLDRALKQDIPEKALKKMTEARIQGEAVAWFRRRYRTLGPLLFMIKNDGRKAPIAKSRDTALGLTPGIPDVMLAVPSNGYNGAFFEFKTPEGRVKPVQTIQLDRLESRGYFVRIVRSLESFKELVTEYLEEEKD